MFDAGKVRSALRSLLFQLLPVLVVFFADASVWTNAGIDETIAAIIALVIGTLARTYLPNVAGARDATIQ